MQPRVQLLFGDGVVLFFLQLLENRLGGHLSDGNRALFKIQELHSYGNRAVTGNGCGTDADMTERKLPVEQVSSDSSSQNALWLSDRAGPL